MLPTANGLQIAIWPALTFALGNQLHLYLQWINVCVALSHNCALNVKAVVAAFNQEKALHRLIVYSTSSESSREQSEAGQPGPGPGPARCIVFIPLSPGIILNEISNSELNLLTIRSAGFYDRKLFTLCKYNFANVKTCFNLRLQLLHSGCEPLT